jgi:hypothetical protein
MPSVDARLDRPLREALPARLAVQAANAGGERLAVEPVQQYVDEVTLPLVTGTEQNALLAAPNWPPSGPASTPPCCTSAPAPRRPTAWCSPSPRPTCSGE